MIERSAAARLIDREAYRITLTIRRCSLVFYLSLVNCPSPFIIGATRFNFFASPSSSFRRCYRSFTVTTRISTSRSESAPVAYRRSDLAGSSRQRPRLFARASRTSRTSMREKKDLPAPSPPLAARNSGSATGPRRSSVLSRALTFPLITV